MALKKRSDIDLKFKWDEWNVYKDHAEWDADFLTLDSLLEPIIKLKGKLHEGANIVVNLFGLGELLNRKLMKLTVHADIHHFQDTRDSSAQGRESKMKSYSAEISAKRSFIKPEILSLPSEQLKEYRDFPGLQPYLRVFDEIIRYKKYTLSAPEEALLSAAKPALRASSKTYEFLTDADLIFPNVIDDDGKSVQLTNGSYVRFLQSYNREVRKGAWEVMYAAHINLKNTLCSTLDGNIKAEIFTMRTRKFGSCLEESLFDDNVPVSVYNSLIDAVHKSLPAFHHYLGIRQRTLKLPNLDMYDIYVPLVSNYKLNVPYEQAVEWVLEALAPLGEEYVGIARKGLTEERWVDVYENEGKRSGGCSMTTYDSLPFILLNYSSTLDCVFTLAHELGHSMHTYYTNRTQPYRYFNYSLLVAEVASTFNEALLFLYLLKKARADGNTQLELYLVNNRCDDFKGTIIRQVQFAEYERDIHAMAEKGEPLTTDSLSTAYKKINDVYYNDTALPTASSAVVLTASQQIAYEFLRVPHFYYNFYVYKYATSMSVSDVLSEGIYNAYTKDPNGAEYKGLLAKYFRMLMAGDSKDPLEILTDVGVDLRVAQTYVNALTHFDRWVNELDRLLLETEKEKK